MHMEIQLLQISLAKKFMTRIDWMTLRVFYRNYRKIRLYGRNNNNI